MATDMQPLSQQHIISTPDICGGKPCVCGTRIRVWDIHIWHNLQGQSPEEIIAGFPQLELADVYAALAYYLDHREEISRQMKQADSLAERMEAEQGPTKFTQLRDGILNRKDGSESDPVSS